MPPRSLAIFLGWTLVVASSAASCRDFSEAVKNTGGDTQGGVPGESLLGDHGGAAGAVIVIAAGAGPESTVAGAGGRSNPESFAGAGATSEGGLGGGTDPGPLDGGNEFGAVRLFIEGEPVCGGTLLNNSWILTADSCVPSDASEMTAAFGLDSSKPDQVQKIAEIARYPGNDGTDDQRGRNLVLLAVEHPFEIAGSTDAYFQPLWFLNGGVEASTQRCAGWSFSPDTVAESSALRVVDLAPLLLDQGVTLGPREAGNWIWWVRTALQGDSFLLPTSADIGSGCFYNINQLRFLMSIHSHLPAQRHDGRDNVLLESVSTALAESAIRSWVDGNMMTEPEHLPLPPLGPVATQWSPRKTLEVLGVSVESGDLLWFTRKDEVWQAPINLSAPSGAALSKTMRPGVIIRRFGEVEVFAVGADGALWWKRRFDSGAWTEWEQVAVVNTPITSGVHVAEQIPGHFHLVARGPNGELRHAEYEDGWLPAWSNLGGPIVGDPAIDVPQEGRINVFFTGPDGQAQQVYYPFDAIGNWGRVQVPYAQALASSPVLGRWSLNVFDFLGRSPLGNVARDMYMGTWGPEWTDLGIPMPAGDPSMALRAPGHGDLFVSKPDGGVWHIAWPRTP